MAVSEIKATKKIGDVEKDAVVAFDFGGDLDAAVELFGKDVIYANFVRSAVITAQAAIRRMLEDGKNQEEVTAKMASWKPGTPLERVSDPIGATIAKFGALSNEDQAALIEKLMAMQK
jgi:hypothetical protein